MKTRKQELDQESDQEKESFSYFFNFLVFFQKFPPQDIMLTICKKQQAYLPLPKGSIMPGHNKGQYYAVLCQQRTVIDSIMLVIRKGQYYAWQLTKVSLEVHPFWG